jgi:hypothetical protein
MKNFLLFVFLVATMKGHGQQHTWCNPLNIDYTYMIYNAHRDISYRSGADPAVVQFRGEYYMFVTRSLGYWHSTDLLHWNFITPEKWYFQGCNAPAAHNYKDSVLYVAGDPSGSMSILYTDNPKKGDWKATPAILNDLQDPALFIDDDDKAYIYWGSSNTYPIRAKKLERDLRFRPSLKTDTLFKLDMALHGWERFGENHGDTVLGGYIEGPWMTKHNNKYYLQYAAPGTEFNVYGDGAYISDSPLGPFRYMANNPFCYKPGGFMNGAGHGSTVLGPFGQYWHFGSMAISVNINWERRICMFPTWFDQDGLMYSNTSFGDYPHYAPTHEEKRGQFTGWMLLSYKKPVTTSSSVGEHNGAHALDESVKTFWLAEKNDSLQWLKVDLQATSKVFAIQVNYHDHQSNLYGRVPGMYHRYTIEGSTDGKSWTTIIDKRNSYTDAPNDYIELGIPQTLRFIRYRNSHVPTPHLAISGLRVFGKGTGVPPSPVKNFNVIRKQDKRDAMITWDKQSGAQGYNILWGVAPNKLYNSWMVYDNNFLDMKSLTVGQSYYFSIEAFNENGVSARAGTVEIK